MHKEEDFHQANTFLGVDYLSYSFEVLSVESKAFFLKKKVRLVVILLKYNCHRLSEQPDTINIVNVMVSIA